MPLQEYVNLELLKLTSRHVSGALALMIAFWLVGLVAEHMVHSGYVLTFIDICEKIVVIAGLTWLTAFVLLELWGMVVRLVRGHTFFATFTG